MFSSTPSPKPYVYLRLAAQPLDVRFEYVAPLRPKVKSEPKGHVQFFVKIADRRYGPFMTAYRATRTQWDSRKSVKPSLEGKRIRTRLGDFSSRLVDAWKAYSGNKEPITAQMLFDKGAFTVIQLVEGGTVYVL